MPKLTNSQQKIYDYLLSRRDEGIPPTVREIRDATGFRSTSTIQAHLNTLENLGLISRRAGLMRAIVINDFDRQSEGLCVPLIGTVTAGEPIYAYEEDLGYVVIDKSIKHGRELFALRVRGDSMINAGILSGDVVVFSRQAYAENGEIVVALIDEEATVKRFYREDGYFRLQPENPAYEPIITDNVRILGKVVTLVRNFE